MYLKSYVSQHTVSSDQEFERLSWITLTININFFSVIYLEMYGYVTLPLEESENIANKQYLINHSPNETASMVKNLVLPLTSFFDHT